MKILFENVQWIVTDEYLLNEENDYWIEVGRLDELRPDTDLLDWPIHMAGKSWVDLRLFVDAFRFAIARFHRDSVSRLDESVLVAFIAEAAKRACRATYEWPMEITTPAPISQEEWNFCDRWDAALKRVSADPDLYL